jgi:hypothetical protein
MKIIASVPVFALLASTAMAQPGLTRGYSSPLDIPITEAELLSQLHTPNEISALVRAALLPPHTLHASTIKLINDELVEMVNGDRELIRNSPPGSLREGDTDFEYEVTLAEVLMHQRIPAGIEGLVAVIHYGNPIWSVIEFGEAAVPALLRAAAYPEDEPGHGKAALDALTQILKKHGPKVSAQSRTGMKHVAREWLANAHGDDNVFALNEAVYLAVATRDPQLRKQVEKFTQGDLEFVNRGISAEWQGVVQDGARKALAELK